MKTTPVLPGPEPASAISAITNQNKDSDPAPLLLGKQYRGGKLVCQYLYSTNKQLETMKFYGTENLTKTSYSLYYCKTSFSFHYNDAGRLLILQKNSLSGNSYNLVYVYDAKGTLLKVEQYRNGVFDGKNEFCYNQYNATAIYTDKHNVPSVMALLEYNAAGNLIKQTSKNIITNTINFIEEYPAYDKHPNYKRSIGMEISFNGFPLSVNNVLKKSYTVYLNNVALEPKTILYDYDYDEQLYVKRETVHETGILPLVHTLEYL